MVRKQRQDAKMEMKEKKGGTAELFTRRALIPY